MMARNCTIEVLRYVDTVMYIELLHQYWYSLMQVRLQVLHAARSFVPRNAHNAMLILA